VVSSVEAPSVSSSGGSDRGLLKKEESFFCFILSLTGGMIGKGDGDGDGMGMGCESVGRCFKLHDESINHDDAYE
jgi:hypothetical protein